LLGLEAPQKLADAASDHLHAADQVVVADHVLTRVEGQGPGDLAGPGDRRRHQAPEPQGRRPGHPERVAPLRDRGRPVDLAAGEDLTGHALAGAESTIADQPAALDLAGLAVAGAQKQRALERVAL